jgi:hypothetical protein
VQNQKSKGFGRAICRGLFLLLLFILRKLKKVKIGAVKRRAVSF